MKTKYFDMAFFNYWKLNFSYLTIIHLSITRLHSEEFKYRLDFGLLGLCIYIQCINN